MLTIPLDSHSSIPLYEQIYSYLKSEIRSGSLPYKTKLPSTRSLAAHLGISRNTVDTAYSQLLSEGWITSYPKKGFYISQINGLAAIQGFPRKTGNKAAVLKRRYRYNFSPFFVDLDHFPYHTWKQLSAACLEEKKDLFLPGMNQGDEAFRNAICIYLHQSRGVNCRPDQIIVGAGVDYLLQLLALLFPKNMNIIMENPTYKRAYDILKGLGFSITPGKLDSNGIMIHPFKEPGAKTVYVTPSHQYPLGIVMPIKRRIELLEWASQDDRHFIIEDDHDSEFRYKGKPIPSLQGIDSLGKVVYIGTFSRAIAPAIRVGYMVLPDSLLEKYQKHFYYFSSTVSRVDQAIITSFMEQGYFERHLNRMRKIYKGKHDLFLHSLKTTFGKTIDIYGEHAGLYLVVSVHTRLKEEEMIQIADKSNIKLYGMYEHFIDEPSSYLPTFLMGYSNLKEEEIITGTKVLYSLLKPYLIDREI